MAESYRYGGYYVGGYVWQIQAQHPPSKLLEYVKSEGREWAIRRALELGLPKSEIREAFLGYAARLRASGNKKDQLHLVSVKHLGLRTGILGPDDLPDVVIPEELLKP